MKTLSLGKLILLLSVLLDSCLGYGLEQDLTLKSIVQWGIQKSLTLQSQELKKSQAEMKVKDSYAGLLPTLSLSAGQTWSKAESEDSGLVSETSQTANSLKVGSSWVLWDHGANIRKIGTSKIDLSSENLTAEKEKQNFVYNVVDSYLQHLLLVRGHELAQRYLDYTRRTHEEATVLVKAGAKTKVEAIDSEISVLDAERNLMEAVSSFKNSERSLKALLNVPESVPIPLVKFLEVKPYYQDRFEKLISKIKSLPPGDRVENSREDQIRRNDIEKSLLDLKQSRWNYWPQVKLAVSHEWDFDQYVNTQTDGTKPILQSTSVGLSLSWTVFDWFMSSRSLQSQEYDFQIKTNSYLDEKRKSIADSENLIEQYEILKKSVESSRLSLQKSKTQLENSQELHRLGRINLLMMQQSTNRYFEAEVSYASRLKNLYLVMAQILIKSGDSIEP